MKNFEKLSVEDLVYAAFHYGECCDVGGLDYCLFDIEQEINRRIRQAKIDVLEEIVAEAKSRGI